MSLESGATWLNKHESQIRIAYRVLSIILLVVLIRQADGIAFTAEATRQIAWEADENAIKAVKSADYAQQAAEKTRQEVQLYCYALRPVPQH